MIYCSFRPFCGTWCFLALQIVVVIVDISVIVTLNEECHFFCKSK